MCARSRVRVSVPGGGRRFAVAPGRRRLDVGTHIILYIYLYNKTMYIYTRMSNTRQTIDGGGGGGSSCARGERCAQGERE